MTTTLLPTKHLTFTFTPTLILILIISLLFFQPTLSTECSCTSSPPPTPPEPEPLIFLDQRLALVYPIIQTFKNIITSDPLGITKTWVGSDICSYRGFYCGTPPDNSSATVLASIDFNGFQLGAPTLDGFIDKLPDLAVFHANTNNFSGTISPNISKLPFIYELDISNNKFCGEFPVSVLGITGLTFLDIRFNFFTGTVPPQVFKKTLDVLFINNNNFMQRLPDDLGFTTALYLTFANNKFTGPIPRSIGKASSTLIEVLFLNNQLTGCLPYELGFLRNATVFDAGNNLLTGPLPCSLGCLEKSKSNKEHCNYFKFANDDDGDVTSTIHSNSGPRKAIRTEELNDVKARLSEMENEIYDRGRRLQRMDNKFNTMIYVIVVCIVLYFIM